MMQILHDLPWMLAMMVFARGSGGGMGADWLVYFVGTRLGAWWGSAASRIPEVLFAGTIAVKFYLATPGGWWCALASVGVFAWVYGWMETGHGNAAHMGVAQFDFPIRHQSLDTVVLPICNRFGWANRGWQYCWLFMGLKWLLVSAPLGILALPLAVVVPAGYAAVMWPQKNRDPMKRNWAGGEIISGLAIGYALAHFPVWPLYS